jgi:hypothetical protein
MIPLNILDTSLALADKGEIEKKKEEEGIEAKEDEKDSPSFQVDDQKKPLPPPINEEANMSYQIFKEMIERGYRGLCLTKTSPRKIEEKFGLEKASIIWLTFKKADGVKSVKPTDIQAIQNLINDYLKRGDNNVVLLDSLEFLIEQNALGYSQRSGSLRSIQTLAKTMKITNTPLITPLSPASIEGVTKDPVQGRSTFIQPDVIEVLFNLQRNIINAFIFEVISTGIIKINPPNMITNDMLESRIRDLSAIDTFFSSAEVVNREIRVDPQVKLPRSELIKKIKWFTFSIKDIDKNIDRYPAFFNLLNKFGIGKAEYLLDQGMSYIIEEREPNYSFELFLNLISHRLPGLCISRIHPNMLRERYRLRDSEVFWLSKTLDKNALNPADIGLIVHTIKKFLNIYNEGVVLLHGVANVITNNSLTTVVKALDDLCEAVMVRKARLIIPTDPAAFDKKEMALLSRDKGIIKPVVERSDSDF